MGALNNIGYKGSNIISVKLYLYNSHSGSQKSLTGNRQNVKLDSKGIPYEYPELRLPKEEYGKVIRAIDDLYASKYEGKSKGWLTLSKETYKFEIHGFNEYNIYEKRKD